MRSVLPDRTVVGNSEMKKLIELAKGLSLVDWAIISFVVFVLVAAIFGFVRKTETYINGVRIDRLESEKQQILKERDQARANDLILQGRIQAKDEVIKTLTSQIAESNAKVINAHTETATARTDYKKVRSDPPKFNSADDAGRIVELGSELQRLYSDTP